MRRSLGDKRREIPPEKAEDVLSADDEGVPASVRAFDTKCRHLDPTADIYYHS